MILLEVPSFDAISRRTRSSHCLFWWLWAVGRCLFCSGVASRPPPLLHRRRARTCPTDLRPSHDDKGRAWLLGAWMDAREYSWSWCSAFSTSAWGGIDPGRTPNQESQKPGWEDLSLESWGSTIDSWNCLAHWSERRAGGCIDNHLLSINSKGFRTLSRKASCGNQRHPGSRWRAWSPSLFHTEHAMERSAQRSEHRWQLWTAVSLSRHLEHELETTFQNRQICQLLPSLRNPRVHRSFYRQLVGFQYPEKCNQRDTFAWQAHGVDHWLVSKKGLTEGLCLSLNTPDHQLIFILSANPPYRLK